LLPEGRQLKTDAHPLVEITVMAQPDKNRTLVHLVNISGHSSTGYFPQFATGEITIEVETEATSARAVMLDEQLDVSRNGRYITFKLSTLVDYEVVILE